MRETRILAAIKNNVIVHKIDKPQYHGDPVNGEILSYRIYGVEFKNMLNELGYTTDHNNVSSEDNMIKNIDIFCSRKPA